MAKLLTTFRGKVTVWLTALRRRVSSFSLRRRILSLGAIVALAALIGVGVWLSEKPQPAYCATSCQCCYCDERPTVSAWSTVAPPVASVAWRCTKRRRRFLRTFRRPAGAAAGETLSGAGIPTAVLKPAPIQNPPTPVPPRPTPPPPPTCPALGEVREWTNLIPPKIGKPEYKPDHPVVLGQDPNKTGFEIHLTFDGGRYEHKTQRLEKVCDDQPEPIATAHRNRAREWH